MSNTPLPIDQITQRKLFLVRQLYQHSEIQSLADRGPVNRIMAVIGFDLAIETALKAVVSALETKEQPDKTFDSLIQQANTKLTKAGFSSLPDEGTIRRVHDTRNHAQHKATYPNETEVSDCRTYTRDFLRKLVLQVWGARFDSINLTDLIQEPQVKQFLTSAQAALDQDDYKNAIIGANAGLSYAIMQTRKKLFPNSFFRLRQPFGDWSTSNHDIIFAGDVGVPTWNALVRLDHEMQKRLSGTKQNIDTLREDVKAEFDALEEVQLCAIIGINYADFLHFRNIAGQAYFYMAEDKELKVNINHMPENPSADDANFVFAYSLETVIQIEAQIGDISSSDH